MSTYTTRGTLLEHATQAHGAVIGEYAWTHDGESAAEDARVRGLVAKMARLRVLLFRAGDFTPGRGRAP